MRGTKLTIIGIICLCGSLLAVEDYREVTRRSYDATAVEYQENTVKLQPEMKAAAFLSYLSPNAQILDLGCGPGRDAKYFIEKGHRVVGIDISSQMIAIARASVPGAEFIVSDIESLDLTTESFDAIWASASLLHVSKQSMPNTLTTIYRTLKPGGIFYVSMKKGVGEEVKADHRYGGVEKFWNYVDEAELIDLLTAQGFQILKQDTHKKSTTYQTHQWISVICQKASCSVAGPNITEADNSGAVIGCLPFDLTIVQLPLSCFDRTP